MAHLLELSVPVPSDRINIAEDWETLRSTLDQVYNEQSPSQQHFINLYLKVCKYFNVYVKATGHPHYQFFEESAGRVIVYQKLVEYLELLVTRRFQSYSELKNEDLLCFYLDNWQQYKMRSKKLNGICAFMNRPWIYREYEEGTMNASNMYQLCLLIWFRFFTKNLTGPITDAVLQLIERERNGEVVDPNLIPGTIQSLIELREIEKKDMLPSIPVVDFYERHFEIHFLEHSEQYYLREARTTFAGYPESESWNIVQQRLDQERTRAKRYGLEKSTEDKLIEIFERVFVPKDLESLLAECKI